LEWRKIRRWIPGPPKPLPFLEKIIEGAPARVPA
jgi:hypothetical protein